MIYLMDHTHNHGVESIGGYLQSNVASDGYKFCYECQIFKSPTKFDPNVCTNCNGFKCHLHGGTQISCDKCNNNNLCGDCAAFGLCCTPTSLSNDTIINDGLPKFWHIKF